MRSSLSRFFALKTPLYNVKSIGVHGDFLFQRQTSRWVSSASLRCVLIIAQEALARLSHLKALLRRRMKACCSHSNNRASHSQRNLTGTHQLCKWLQQSEDSIVHCVHNHKRRAHRLSICRLISMHSRSVDQPLSESHFTSSQGKRWNASRSSMRSLAQEFARKTCQAGLTSRQLTPVVIAKHFTLR